MEHLHKNVLDTDNMSGCGGVREGQSWEEPAGPSLPASLISGREGVRGDSGAVPRLGCGGLGALRLGLCKSFLHLGQSELTGVVGGLSSEEVLGSVPVLCSSPVSASPSGR